MKRHGIHSANCSCTSCVYRSRSKQPSVQQLIEEGSRIDKLYYGKYLPLRERKLLEKLIRTRAVYDDVRNQLLSTSGSSDQARSEHKIKRRDDDSTEKSSAVIKMVDLVDRGELGSANASKLSSCCSCCSCSSLRKIKKHMEKHPPRVHKHHIPYEEIARYTVEAEKRGRKRRKRLSTKVSSKIRNVHFKMKKIRSEPCTCTLSLSSVMKRPSKAFIQKIRSRENAAANAQAQKVTVVRKPLKEKICSCSCKIAKIPMKSIQKMKNIRKSTTKSSGTDMGNQKAFRIKKDSLTLFREKLLQKRAYKDWECEPGTCVVDECIPEHCFKKIKARGVGGRKRVKYHNRISGTSIDKRNSMSTRARQVKRIDSKVQATPGSTAGPVICECKPTTKSASSMTSFPNQKSLVKIKSKERADKADRYLAQSTESYEFYETEREPKNKLVPGVKETIKQEKVHKTGRYEKKSLYISPGPNLGHVRCECKPYTKSISSMTSIPKTKVSKTMKPKARPQVLMKETVIQEKDYKATNRKAAKQTEFYSAEREQTLPASKLGSVICECPEETESAYSMTSGLKTQATQSVSKSDIKVKRPITPKQRLQKDTKREKVYKTAHQKEMVQVAPKLGYAICECHPSIKSIFSLSSLRKAHRAKPRKPKPGVQVVIKEEKVYKTGPRKPNQIKQIKSHEIQIVQAVPKSKLGNVLCECKPKTKSISSMTTTTTRSKTQMKAKVPKQYKVHRPDRLYKARREQYEYHETEQEQSEKQAVKISSSFKFEIEFSKKKYPALTNKEIVEHVKKKRAKRIKPTHSRRRQYPKYRNSKIQVTGAKSKSSHESQISYLRESASQTPKPYHDIELPFPRECEPSMCIPYECDPKSCARILLSRSKSRGRSAMASTDRLRRKSVGSTTLSQNTSSKSRYVQSKSTESFVRHPRETKVPPRQNPIKENIHSESPNQQKQAVRITSSFNFNVEFYKESPEIKTKEVEQVAYEPRREIKQTVHRKKYKQRGHGARNVNSRNFSSQSRSSQSFKNIQVGHKLKRCFCTLKLLQKKKHIKYPEKRARPRPAGVAYVTPPPTPHSKSGPLYPCSCSEKSNITIMRNPKSGPLNPCECSERTNITNMPRKSLSRIRQQKAKRFNEIEKNIFYDKPNKREMRKIQGKGIKVHKPQVRHAASLTNKNLKAKQTYTTPFLQRCFCTLKLLKRNKDKTGKVTPFSRRNDYIVHMQNKSITNNRAKIKNQKCECEPVPVECDPYKCEKIAKRHMKLQRKYSNTGDHATRSSFSGTSRTVTASKSRNSHSYIRGSGDKAMKTTEKVITTPSQSNRQAVRVGSNFSFNIEFYKENPSANTDNINAPEILPRKQPRDMHIKKYNHKVKTTSQQFKRRSHHKAITAEAKHKEKGVFIGSAIRRCFCTLKFNKTGKDKKLKEKKVETSKSTKTSYPLPNPQICECKSTSTKIGKPVYDLKSYESGMCNPYECYEELKRREIKRLHNKHINTIRNKRKSTVSMTTTEFTVGSKTKSTQSRLLKQTKSKKDQRLRALHEDIRSTRSIPPSRQAVHLGSNFSFNVEFFKEHSSTSAHKTAHKIRPVDFNSISSRTIKKNKGTKDRGLVVRNRLSQAMIRKEDKAANVGFILKRCFCTLGLQKKKKPQHEFGNYPPITVQIVQMDRNPKNTCKSVLSHINRTENLNFVNGHNIIKPRYGPPNKTIYEKECLKFNDSESIYAYKDSIFDMNQNIYHLPQYLRNFRSRIDFNVGEYQVGNFVIDAQEANPFYQSFYALNVKVSKLKNVPGDTHALGDYECAPGVCVPYECDPTKCLKMINERIKLTKTSATDRRKNKTIGTTNMLKSKSVTTDAHLNKQKRKLNYKDHSSHSRARQNSKARSGVNIDMGLHKNKNPHTDGLKFSSPHKLELTQGVATRQSLRLGTDLNFGMRFSKDTNRDNDHQGLQHADPLIKHESQHKAKTLLAKCLCPIKKITETRFKSYKPEPSQQGHQHHKQLRLGTDLSLTMGFYKDTSSGGDNAMTNGVRSSFAHAEPQKNQDQRNKTKELLAKCLCPIRKLTETQLTSSQNNCSCHRSQRSSFPSRRALRVGSDFSLAMGFYKDRHPHRNGFMVSSSPKSKLGEVATQQPVKGTKREGDNVKMNTLYKPKYDKKFKCECNNYSQNNVDHQNKAVPTKKSLLAKCLCPIKKISAIQSSLYKQKPRQNKRIPSPPKAERLKSNLNIAMGPCNFCKYTKHHNGHMMCACENAAPRSSQSRFTHSDPQIIDKKKKTTSGISQLITKCFCIAKQKNKTKQGTQTEKTGKSTVIELGKKTNKKKLKAQDKGAMTPHSKNKSTSSLVKKSRGTKTKTVESTPTNYSNYSKYSSSQNQIDHGPKDNRALERQGVSFGSNISFSMAFIKDRNNSNSSLSSVFHQSKPINNLTQINQGARVSPVYFSKIEKTGYNQPKTEDPELHYVTKGKKYKKDHATFKRKSSTKIKSILKSYDCTPNTCMPNKCVSIECDKHAKKRPRSKTTKVTKEKKATSTKSAVIDRGTATKGKRLSKSFDQCHPQECKKNFEALGINYPDVGKKTKKKGKKTPQIEEKKCYCTVPSKQSTIKQKKTLSKKQTDLNKFIQNCFCALKRIKGGKELTPKPSKERITDGKKEKSTCDRKTCKAIQDNEMKTIMPYSKKKFKKHDSQIKVTEVATNTMASSFCPCVQETLKQETKPKTVKKSKFTEKNKGNVLHSEDKLVVCPMCQNPLNEKSGKNKMAQPSCFCTITELEHNVKQQQSVKVEGKKKKGGKDPVRSIGPIGDQMAVCPECQRNALSITKQAKSSKKRDKNNGVHLHLVPEKVGDQLDMKQQEQLAKLNLCPVCTAKLKISSQDKQIKKQDKKKDCSKKTPLLESKRIPLLESNECKCCQRKCNSEKKVTKQDVNKMKTPTCEEPLFEMYVNHDNMNILNKDEVIANLNSSGEEIIQTRNVCASPVMEMVIDKHNASIINCRQLLQSLKEREKMENEYLDSQKAKPAATQKKKTASKNGKPKAKSIGAAETQNKRTPQKKTVGKQKAKSIGTAEKQSTKASTKKKPVGKQKAKSVAAAEKQNKKASAKQTKSERPAYPKPHGSQCKCCVCCTKTKRPKEPPPDEEEVEEEEEEEEEEEVKQSLPKFRKLKPCICGSVVCKKDWEKIYSEQRSIQSMKKVKPCVCGSNVCKEESQKIPELLLKAARREQKAKLKAKQAIRDEKRYQKERLQRRKMYAIEDKKRYKQRRKQDKIDMKKLKKYEEAPDCLMVAESLVDFGRFGAKAVCDIMTTACRYIKHPRDAIHNIKDYSNKPGRATKHVKETCAGMGFFSTLARVKRRAINMKFTKKAIVKLESYPVTNYVVHMADKDPRKRMKKFKQKRTREPMDFECSLFMASLRKRPCLAVYYTCPWFYPHCVSLLGLWKQFTDILLFILAVGVWSPCIITMELCRALMCCCLCTG